MSSPFKSFFMGGFECATHQRTDRLRVDVIAASGHDRMCAVDYELLQQAGVRTVRDGLRWHLVESADGVYDWSSFLPMLEASCATGMQVIWDLCHWGVPAGLDLFSTDFPRRFAAFASAAARIVQAHCGDAIPFYCPINEMSFWAWIGGDIGAFGPHQRGRGVEVKQQLVAASLAAMRAIRAVDPRARFVQPEPIIHVSTHMPEAQDDASRHIASQFEAWDMLRGDRHPELGGDPGMLDVIGVNYYWDNQWVLGGGEKTPLGHHHHRPLHLMLVELWQRYGRPILVTETGAEASAGPGWLGYISSEVRQAQRHGAQVLGICLYPVMDYPGWDDERHCGCGLIEVQPGWGERRLRDDLTAEMKLQATLFDPS